MDDCSFYKECCAKFEEIGNWIKEFDKIVIIGHVDPDGDCIGSQLAMLQAIKKQYPEKKVYAPLAMKNNLKFLLPKNYQNEITEKEMAGALLILVDIGELARLPKSIKIKESNKIIKIDHHPDKKEKEVNLSWVDPQNSSSCEMIYFLLKYLKLPIDTKIATALLTGMITDSGSFRFKKTNARTFWVASKLAEKAMPVFEINQRVFQTHETTLKTRKWVLENYVRRGKLIYVKFNVGDKKILPYIKSRKDITNLINIFENIKGVKVWVTIIQTEKDQPVAVSLRSKENTKVNVFAQKYGGGGHENAAGAKLQNWAMVDQLIKDLESHFS